jgi:hypothetical protein
VAGVPITRQWRTYLDQYRLREGRWRIAWRTVKRPFDLGPIPGWAPPFELGGDDLTGQR